MAVLSVDGGDACATVDFLKMGDGELSTGEQLQHTPEADLGPEAKRLDVQAFAWFSRQQFDDPLALVSTEYRLAVPQDVAGSLVGAGLADLTFGEHHETEAPPA